jgi:hypothetical protein
VQEVWLYCRYALAVDALLPSSSLQQLGQWRVLAGPAEARVESGEVAALEQADHVALVALRMFR